jgi:hypothetical protein
MGCGEPFLAITSGWPTILQLSRVAGRVEMQTAPLLRMPRIRASGLFPNKAETQERSPANEADHTSPLITGGRLPL